MTDDRRTAAAALLISMFLAGVVGGAAFMRVLQGRPGPHPLGWRDGGGPGGRMPPVSFMPDSTQPPRGFAPMALSQRLSQELDLTEDQREQLEEIIEEREAAASAIMDSLGPRLQAQLDSMNAAIRALLTPEQAEVFDRWLEREEAFRRRPPGEGRPPGDGRRPGEGRAPGDGPEGRVLPGGEPRF